MEGREGKEVNKAAEEKKSEKGLERKDRARTGLVGLGKAEWQTRARPLDEQDQDGFWKQTNGTRGDQTRDQTGHAQQPQAGIGGGGGEKRLRTERLRRLECFPSGVESGQKLAAQGRMGLSNELD